MKTITIAFCGMILISMLITVQLLIPSKLDRYIEPITGGAGSMSWFRNSSNWISPQLKHIWHENQRKAALILLQFVSPLTALNLLFQLLARQFRDAQEIEEN